MSPNVSLCIINIKHNKNSVVRVRNPGRGVFWSGPIFNGLDFYNNHIITNTTATPRTEGLFGFKQNANNAGDTPDLSTISITSNIIEMNGLSRPLVRNSDSPEAAAITIDNNTLVNVADTANYANPDTGLPRGPVEPLVFPVGVNGEFTVNGFTITATPLAPCDADLDGDGDADEADLVLMLSLTRDGDPAADIDGNGSVDAFDGLEFLRRYEAGC
ncbi:MAG: GC-type dockerin domain-anchored protein [Planctomycetota bacterium]